MYASVLALTALWHGLAFWHFYVRAERTIAIFTYERPVSPIAGGLIRFLGGLNLAVAALAAVAIPVRIQPMWPIFGFLALANLSQLWIDVQVHRQGLTKQRFTTTILLGDGVATVANLACALLVAV